MTLPLRVLRCARWLLPPLLLAAAGGAWLVFTASGTRWLLDTGVRLAGAELHYARLSGSLARGLDLDEVELRLPSATFAVDEAALRWRPRALLRGAVAIERVVLARGELALKPSEPSSRTARFSVPLPIDVESLEVHELAIVSGAARHRVERLTLGLHAAGDALELRALELDLDAHRVSGRAALRDGGDTLETDLAYAGVADGMPLAGRLQLAGPRARLATTLTLTAPFAAAVSGEVNVDAPAPRVDLQGSASPNAWLAARGIEVGVDELAFTLTGAAETLALRVTAQVSAPGLAATAVSLDATRLPDAPGGGPRAQLEWRLAPREPLLGVTKIEGGGELAWRDGRLEIHQTLRAPSPLELAAEIEPGTPPRVKARGEWQALALALGDTPLRSPRGSVTVDGAWPALAVSVDAKVDDARVGGIELRADAKLGEDRVDLTRLRAALLEGTLEAQGALSTFTPPTGAFDVRLRGLDLAPLREGLDTRLDADATVTLAGPRLRVELAQATGRWRGQRVDAHGGVDLVREADQLRASVEDLELAIGRNRLAVNGGVGDALALDFTLDLPAAETLDAQLAGRVSGKGSLRGTPAAPLLEAELAATALRAGELRVDTASLRASIAPATTSTLVLDARGVHHGAVALGTLSLDARGTPEAHTLTLDAGTGERRLALRAAGSVAGERVDGTLQALTLTWPELGAWQLDAAARYRYGGGALTLSPLCLAQQTARACVDLRDLSRTAGRVHVRLEQVPTALAAPWLPPQLELLGTLGGELSAVRGPAGWRPSGTLAGEGVTVIAPLAGKGPTRLPFAPLALAFRDTDDGQRFELDAANPDLGALHADGLLRDALDAPTLEARLQLRTKDLRTLAALVPALGGSEGGFTLDATLQGPLAQPAVNAQARLVDGRLRLERLGITLDALRLDAAMRTPERLELDLALGQDGQKLAVTGHVQRAAQWPFALHVKSERFTLMRRAELDLDVAPDLDLDGTLEAVRMRGEVTLPKLDLRLQQLPADAVNVSEDEVLIDEAGDVVADDAPESSASRFYRERVSGALTLTLGDEARVRGLGLDAKLTGKLRFSKDADSFGFAEGRITLKDGQYVAYGQTLTLKKGELLFAGPLDNPALDVLALRPKLSVKAGVAITGTAQAPLVRLYSVPAMADLETLSYVVTGQALGSTNRSSADMLAKAALGLGLDQAAGLTAQLRDWFRLDELGVNGGKTVDATSFVAGKQLTPRMRVRSEFNPFDRVWSVFLRYRLTPQWSVEGESGARQGADVIYSIERDTLF